MKNTILGLLTTFCIVSLTIQPAWAVRKGSSPRSKPAERGAAHATRKAPKSITQKGKKLGRTPATVTPKKTAAPPKRGIKVQNLSSTLSRQRGTSTTGLLITIVAGVVTVGLTGTAVTSALVGSTAGVMLLPYMLLGTGVTLLARGT